MAIIIPRQEEERVKRILQSYWKRFCDIKEYMELSERLSVSAPYNFNITLYADLADDIYSLLYRFAVNNSSATTDGTLIGLKRIDLIKLTRSANIMKRHANHLFQYHVEMAEYDSDGQLDRYYRDISHAVEKVTAIENDFARYQISKVLRLVLDTYGIEYAHQDQMTMM